MGEPRGKQAMNGDRQKKRKLMCLSYAALLMVCFFLPLVEGCRHWYKHFVPAAVLLSDQGPPPCDTCFEVFTLWLCYGLPHVFGGIVVIICVGSLARRGEPVRVAAGIVLFLGLIGATAFLVQHVYPHVARLPSRSPIALFRICVLWPVAGIATWWLTNSLRPRYIIDAKLSVWQLVGSLMSVVWCATWFFDISLFSHGLLRMVSYGLWLTTFSSVVLLIYFGQECKAALDCSWKELLPALFGFQKRSSRQNDNHPEPNHLPPHT